MGDPPYVTSKPVRQDLRGSPWSAGQANSAERWLWKTVFRRLSTCLSTGILNIIVYHIICGKSTPIVENFMNSTKFPRGNLRKLWRAKTDKKRAFSTGGAAWKVARRSLCGIALYIYRNRVVSAIGVGNDHVQEFYAFGVKCSPSLTYSLPDWSCATI